MVASIRPVYIHTLDALHEMVEHYQGQDEYVYDVESMGARRGTPAVNRVVWLSFATEGRADIVPLGHPNGEVLHRGHSFKEAQWDPRNVGKRGTPLKKWVTVQREPAFTPAPPQLRPSQVFPILEPLFFSDQTVIGHNLSFDLSSIAKYYDGKVPPPPYGDTFAAAKLLFTEKQPAGLKPMTLKYFEHDYDKEDVGKCIEKHAFSKVARYALLDAVYTWEFWKELVPVLDKQGLQKIFELEMSLIPAVCEMALEGVPIDETPMTELSVEMSQDIREVLKRIWSEVGKVDLAKPTEVRKLVYETRGHEPFAYTEGSCKHHGPDDPHTPICTPKADKAVLEAYTHDPVVADLMRWRKLTKLYSTYVGEKTEEGFRGGLLEHMSNGRVYTSLKPFGAATGRFSSEKPNLQNIPARGEAGAQIRKLFVTPPGHKLLVLDYGQIEYRVLAHLSGDPTLTQAFLEGWDPHQATAALLLGKRLEDVLPEERDRGKTANFAQVYGAGARKVAGGMGVSVQEAYKMFEEYERRFPDIISWKKEVVRDARRRTPPCVWTLGGRRRILAPLTWADDGMRSFAERQAVNTMCQGTAADIMKMALIKVQAETPENWKLLLTVHDELMMAIPEDETDEALPLVKELMESVNILSVPLEVDGGVGPTWADAK